MGGGRVESAAEESETLAERLSRAFLGTQELLTVELGRQLGLYQALAERGPLSAPQLAAQSGLDQRYLDEWLQQQAVAGFVTVDQSPPDGGGRRYRLDRAARGALLDCDSLDYVGALAGVATGLAVSLPEVVGAFRTGGGVPPQAYGQDLSGQLAVLNRTVFLNLLDGWLGALPTVHNRLAADPPAKVADIGCGLGWSSIALALAYPKVTVHGLDLDPQAVTGARGNAAQAGVGDRTAFFAGDAAASPLEGPFDLVTCFEALHDMAQPVAALGAMRRLLGVGGRVLIAEERVAARFEAPGDRRERSAYCWSVLFCLPTGRSEAPSAATGAVLRASKLARYAEQAGFGDVTITPVDDPVWRFYLLDQ